MGGAEAGISAADHDHVERLRHGVLLRHRLGGAPERQTDAVAVLLVPDELDRHADAHVVDWAVDEVARYPGALGQLHDRHDVGNGAFDAGCVAAAPP